MFGNPASVLIGKLPITVTSSGLPSIPASRPSSVVPTTSRSAAEPAGSASHSWSEDIGPSGGATRGASTYVVPLSRRSREDAPTATSNSPASSTQSRTVSDQNDRSRASRSNAAAADSPGASSSRANPFSSRAGRATDDSTSAT